MIVHETMMIIFVILIVILFVTNNLENCVQNLFRADDRWRLNWIFRCCRQVLFRFRAFRCLFSRLRTVLWRSNNHVFSWFIRHEYEEKHEISLISSSRQWRISSRLSHQILFEIIFKDQSLWDYVFFKLLFFASYILFSDFRSFCLWLWFVVLLLIDLRVIQNLTSLQRFNDLRDMRRSKLQEFNDLRDRMRDKMLWLRSNFARIQRFAKVERCFDCETTRIWSKRDSKE